MVQNQLLSFWVYAIVGILLGFIFDIFRSFRITVKSSNFATNIEDIFFLIIAFMLVVISMQFFSDGELRFYILLGIILGITFYFSIISKFILKGETWFLKSILKVLKNIFKLIVKKMKDFDNKCRKYK